MLIRDIVTYKLRGRLCRFHAHGGLGETVGMSVMRMPTLVATWERGLQMYYDQNGFPNQTNGFRQQGASPRQGSQNGAYGDSSDGWSNNGNEFNQDGGRQYDAMMPQPTYAGGMPQPIRQPMHGSSTAAGFAGSKSFRSGIASVLWLLFGWIIVVGPIVAFFMGISAIIKGIKELIRSAFVGGFGTAAAIIGIVLGLVGGGVSGTGMFLFGRAAYVIGQAEMSDTHVDMDSDGAIFDLFWHGKARYLSDAEYYGYDGEYDADGEDVTSDVMGGSDVAGVTNATDG